MSAGQLATGGVVSNGLSPKEQLVLTPEEFVAVMVTVTGLVPERMVPGAGLCVRVNTQFEGDVTIGRKSGITT
jgi:hypothetical protein